MGKQTVRLTLQELIRCFFFYPRFIFAIGVENSPTSFFFPLTYMKDCRIIVIKLPSSNKKLISFTHFNYTAMQFNNDAPPSYEEATAPVPTVTIFPPKNTAPAPVPIFIPRPRLRLPSRKTHLNYIWKSLEDVRYERFPPGRQFLIAGADGEMEPIKIPAEQLLKTKIFDRPGTDHLVGRLCRFFHTTGECVRGGHCDFAHRATIDSNTEYLPDGYPQRVPRDLPARSPPLD